MTPAARIPAHSFDHPAFAVIESSVRSKLLSLDHFPAPHEFRALTQGLSHALSPWFDFAEQDSAQLLAAGSFDRLLAGTELVPTRPNSFHDLFGALIWLHFPALKTAIHLAHLAGHPKSRGPRENAATHLDESGVLVLGCEPSIFEALSALRWVEVFWQRRAQLRQTTRFLVFGHGLLDCLREPHPRLMGKALFARVSPAQLALDSTEFRVLVDAALAKGLSEFLGEPACLEPLPVLGVPGWSPNQSRSYYEDERYFRIARQRARAPSVPRWLELG